MAITLVSKMFGSGLQVDRQHSSNTRNVYVPPPPTQTHGEGHYPYNTFQNAEGYSKVDKNRINHKQK